MGCAGFPSPEKWPEAEVVLAGVAAEDAAVDAPRAPKWPEGAADEVAGAVVELPAGAWAVELSEGKLKAGFEAGAADVAAAEPLESPPKGELLGASSGFEAAGADSAPNIPGGFGSAGLAPCCPIFAKNPVGGVLVVAGVDAADFGGSFSFALFKAANGFDGAVPLPKGFEPPNDEIVESAAFFSAVFEPPKMPPLGA